MSLRLTFCLSPQTQIVYFCIFWSTKAMLSSQCGLQYCRSSQHTQKKTCCKFPFFFFFFLKLVYIADPTVYSNKRLKTTSEMWPLHFSILENDQVCDLKCVCVWLNLSITLYMCSHVQMCSPLVVEFQMNNSIFELFDKTSRGSHLFDHNCLCVYVCLNQLS